MGETLSGGWMANGVHFLDAYSNPFGYQAVAAAVDRLAAAISDCGDKSIGDPGNRVAQSVPHT